MEINLKGLNFLVDPTNYQEFWNNFLKWEKNDLQFVTEIGEENKIFIDVGAWIGPYTLLAAKLGMKVYAFEPDKVAFEELKKNIQLNRFKHEPEIFNFGLSKKFSKAYLYSNTNDFGKSESGLINYKNEKNTKKTQIELKNFLQEIDKIKKNNLNLKIKILKIDIEGGEFLFEKNIYDLVRSEKIYCMLSYHHMVFNKNKFKKNFFKIKTLFYQILIDKIYPSKNVFKIANIFKNK
tara:strand:+ start:687 stop:1394 length:708 start_codon:yes stop_codon:yes gene_type:complete